jgi:hypothetical protein
MVPMRLAAEVIGTAPIERLDVLHGANVVQTARPFTAAACASPGKASSTAAARPCGREN